MAVLSFVVEGPTRMGQALGTAFTLEALPADLGLLYIVLVALLSGTASRRDLLGTYPSSTVAPFSMLVPVVGVLALWVAFGEVPDLVEVLVGVVVVGGVLWASRSGRSAATAPANRAAIVRRVGRRRRFQLPRRERTGVCRAQPRCWRRSAMMCASAPRSSGYRNS